MVQLDFARLPGNLGWRWCFVAEESVADYTAELMQAGRRLRCTERYRFGSASLLRSELRLIF